jgi:hypothetical protein
MLEQLKKKSNLIISALLFLCLSTQSFGATDDNSPALFFYNLKIKSSEIKTPKIDKDGRYLAENLANYHKLLKIMKDLDKFVTSYSDNITGLIEEGDGVLTGEHIYHIGKAIQAYHHLTLQMLEFSTIYNVENLENYDQLVDYTDKKKTLSNLIWLSNHVVLFSHNYNIYDKLMRLGSVRRTMKNVLKTEILRNLKLQELKQMIAHTMAKNNQIIIKNFLISFKKHENSLKDMYKIDSSERKLITIISNHKGSKVILDKEGTYKFSNHSFIDRIVNTLSKITDVISGFFGNSVGVIRWREGHLFQHKSTQVELHQIFKPLDILLEKTRFALTDTFIPGNFGHAALWLGTETQLKELGLWNSATIKPYQQKIREGYQIVEAIRPGVRLTTLKDFMQIDEIAILRNKNIDKDLVRMEQTFNIAFDQLGKDYDFNFDVGTISTIVCSELIFMAMGNIKWPTTYVLGRATISPDNLAELVFYEGSPIELLHYVDAQKRHIPLKLESIDLAQRIGYTLNKETSTAEKPVFDKKELVCKTVYSRRVRVGSHRDRRLKKRVCLTKLEHKIYKAPRAINNW